MKKSKLRLTTTMTEIFTDRKEKKESNNTRKITFFDENKDLIINKENSHNLSFGKYLENVEETKYPDNLTPKSPPMDEIDAEDKIQDDSSHYFSGILKNNKEINELILEPSYFSYFNQSKF